LDRAELTVCCCMIRFSWHKASCPREILRFSTVSSPEVQKRRGADVDFQAAWAHVSNQEHHVSPRGASDWCRDSVRKSVSVHQDKIRGSAIVKLMPLRGCTKFHVVTIFRDLPGIAHKCGLWHLPMALPRKMDPFLLPATHAGKHAVSKRVASAANGMSAFVDR